MQQIATNFGRNSYREVQQASWRSFAIQRIMQVSISRCLYPCQLARDFSSSSALRIAYYSLPCPSFCIDATCLCVFVRPVYRSTGLSDFDQGDASCGEEAELQNFVHAQVCRGHQSVSRAQGSEWRYRDFIRTSGTAGFRMRSGRVALNFSVSFNCLQNF